MEVSVRAAAPGDAPAIERVFIEAARAAWAHFLPAEGLAGLAAPGRRRAEAVLVAEVEGLGVVGFAALRRSQDADADPSTGELDLIYTSPSVWGRGVGRTLMTVALDHLRADGYREATLWTAEQNERPRRFYERAGWSLDGAQHIKTSLGATFTEMRYRISLAP